MLCCIWSNITNSYFYWFHFDRCLHHVESFFWCFYIAWSSSCGILSWCFCIEFSSHVTWELCYVHTTPTKSIRKLIRMQGRVMCIQKISFNYSFLHAHSLYFCILRTLKIYYKIRSVLHLLQANDQKLLNCFHNFWNFFLFIGNLAIFRSFAKRGDWEGDAKIFLTIFFGYKNIYYHFHEVRKGFGI